MSFHDARDRAMDLAALCPSMDVKPNHDLTDGLIDHHAPSIPRAGSRASSGRLSDAVSIATQRNPPRVWQGLRDSVPRTAAAVASGSAAALGAGGRVPVNGRRGPARPLGRHYLAVATSGVYDEQRSGEF